MPANIFGSKHGYAFESTLTLVHRHLFHAFGLLEWTFSKQLRGVLARTAWRYVSTDSEFFVR